MKLFKNALGAIVNAWRSVGTNAAHLRREYIIGQYLRAGAKLGDTLAKLYLGECLSLADDRKRFTRCERRYASLGYRTIALDDFIEYAYGKSIKHLLRITRAKDEAPVYYADAIEQRYKEGFRPMQDFGGQKHDWMRCGLEDAKKGDDASGACDSEDCRHLQDKDAKKNPQAQQEDEKKGPEAPKEERTDPEPK